MIKPRPSTQVSCLTMAKLNALRARLRAGPWNELRPGCGRSADRAE
ncbi:MAG TPA: hypothetical protein GXX29_03060 [Firmicutes bacterium]|nr:hypothetical protein [Bacillota bacterium]